MPAGKSSDKSLTDGLAMLYDWFIESFGTADMKNAKALLEELK